MKQGIINIQKDINLSFQELVEIIPFPTFLIDPFSGKYLCCNQLFLDLIQVKQELIEAEINGKIFSNSLFNEFLTITESQYFKKNTVIEREARDNIEIEILGNYKILADVEIIVITVKDKSIFSKELALVKQQNRLMAEVQNYFPFISFTTNSFYNITSCHGLGLGRLNKIASQLTGGHIDSLFGNISSQIEKVKKLGSLSFELYGSNYGEPWCFNVFIIDIENTGIMGFAIDITEQKIADAAQEKIKRQLQQITSNIPGAVFQLVKSKDGVYNIVYISQGFDQLFGLSAESILKDISGFYQRFSSGDVRVLKHLVIDSGIKLTSFNFEAELVGKTTDKKKWVRITAMPNENNDHSITWYGTASDITHSKNTENELIEKQRFIQKVTETTPDVIYVYDVQLQKNIFCNREIGELLGYTEEEITILQPSLKNELIHPEDINKLADYFEEVKKLKDNNVLELEYRFKNKKGIYTWFLTRNTVFLRTRTGSVRQFMGTIVNIHRRKIAEQQTLERNLELLKINSELDQFVYSTSHDLRAPLTSIEGLIGLIKEEQDQERKDEFIDLIEKSVVKLDIFIKRILDYSRNSRLPAKIILIDFRELFNDIVELLQFGAKATNVRFELILENDNFFYSDYDRLHIILSNLISNAIRYYNPEQKDPYVLVKAILLNDNAVITVADNGLGMDVSHLDKIFDMFYRISSKSEGSGLGLYIVKESISKINGTITVNSVLKVGTCFTIIIPNSKQS